MRLGTLLAIALVLMVYVWGVWPAATRPSTRPALRAPTAPFVPPTMPALSAEDETVLAAVRDGEAVSPLPLYYLLKRASAAGATQEAPLAVEPGQLLAQPGAFRGRLVRLEGVFLREYAVELPENLAGVRQTLNGDIGSAAGTITSFVLPVRASTGCRVGDSVELTGYFLQVRRFAGADGQMHDGPLVIGRALTGLRRPEPIPLAWIVSLGVSAVMVVGLVAGLTVLKQRRRKKVSGTFFRKST